MDLFDQFQKLDIDFEAIGLMKGRENLSYFCTPKGAKILGWAGVDGIHYCQIKAFGEMVFAISPANLPGEYVHPIAHNFEVLLALLLASGSMDAIEQAHLMSREQFESYLLENRPGNAAATAFEKIRTELSITPKEDPYGYIRALQKGFDYSRIPYTKEYYETAGEPEPPKKPEWKVTFHGGILPRSGRGGKEVRIDKTFRWGEDLWHIPAAYLCTEGLVLDLFAEVEPERVTTFIEKWDLLHEDEHAYTDEEQDQIAQEHPLNIDFDAILTYGGEKLKTTYGCGTVWVPSACVGNAFSTENDAKEMLLHYGYDLSRAWSVRRMSFPWNGKRPKKLGAISLKLMRDPEEVPAGSFCAPAVGESIVIKNPITYEEYLLTVHEYEQEMLAAERFGSDPDTEYPLHYAAMVYTLFPEPDKNAWFLKDCSHGDSPRIKNAKGVVGGAIGVIGMIHRGERQKYRNPDGTPANAHVACSSLHFVPVDRVEWRFLFREKRVTDLDVELL